MAVWSTGPPGDPESVAHRMIEDPFGRPGDPACGISRVGLWFRARTWEQVPPAQRCPECTRLQPCPT